MESWSSQRKKKTPISLSVNIQRAVHGMGSHASRNNSGPAELKKRIDDSTADALQIWPWLGYVRPLCYAAVQYGVRLAAANPRSKGDVCTREDYWMVFGFDVTFHVEVAGVVISMREIRMGVSQCESGSGRVGDGGERRGWERRYGGEIGHMEGVAYGAFRFLKPTTRKEVINWESGRRGGREGTDDELLRDERGRDEVKRDEPIVRGQKAGRNADGDRERKEIIMRTWRSRDNRKGRHAITLPPSAAAPSNPQYPTSTSTYHAILAGLLRMITRFPYYDISYLIAMIFTLGSIIWCINAFFVWLPLEKPSSEFPGEIADAGGISAFIGATVFELGSILLMLEAVNEDQTDCFGWAIEEVWEEETRRWRKGVREDRARCRHHHHRSHRNLVGKSGERRSDEEEAKRAPATTSSTHTWQWCPSLASLSTHYVHSLGFLACSAQLFGASIFWISGFTALPPIYTHFTSTRAANSAYWLPQVVGGTGFIVSGLLFMLETQSAWYRPAWRTLGWHIGAWNLVGGIGFTLCGALGFAAQNSGAVYQGSLATFWGSWCFLVGSVVQWYESLEKFPVEVDGRVVGN